MKKNNEQTIEQGKAYYKAITKELKNYRNIFQFVRAGSMVYVILTKKTPAEKIEKIMNIMQSITMKHEGLEEIARMTTLRSQAGKVLQIIPASIYTEGKLGYMSSVGNIENMFVNDLQKSKGKGYSQ